MIDVPLTKLIATLSLMSLLLVGVVAETTAQSEALRLTLTNIESRNFPEVVVSAAVVDAEGPVEGLTGAAFQVFEDEAETPAEIVSVESTRLENLRLVMAVDVSTPDSDLTGVKAAALSIVDNFSPKDRLALLSFGDDVQIVREFTNNQEELATAIQGLRGAGSLTALNEATAEAVNLSTQVAEGRRAVIVITDRLDNTASPASFSGALEEAVVAGVPVYVVGYGSKIPASETLESQMKSTGGQYVTLPGADGLETALAEVEQTVRQGYKITFASDLEADNADHPLSMVVDDQTNQAQADGLFTATPGAVNITLPSIEPGQTVSGVVELAPVVITPAALVSVEYLLDDQPLETVTVSPFDFAWDSTTAEAGLHILSMQATDQAGNVGQMRIAVSVMLPLKVEISTGQESVRLGDELPISANVEASAPIAKMELLIDGALIDTRTDPPYLFDLNSGQYSQGEHEITLRVETLGSEGEAGQVAEDSLTLQFLPPPGSQPNFLQRFLMNFWVRLIGVMIATLAALGATFLIALLLLRMIRRWHHNRSRQRLHLEIWNLSNIEGVYQLQAKEATDSLKFQFTLNGQVLPQHTIAQPIGRAQNGRQTKTQPLPATSAAAYEPTTPNGGALTAQPAATEASTGSGVRQTASKVREREAQARGCTYALIDILDTLGMLLPGSAGSAIRNYGARLYQGQRAVDQTLQAPTQMAHTAQHLSGQVSSLGPASPRSAFGHDMGQMAERVAPAPMAQRQSQPLQTGRQQSGKGNQFLTATESWAWTPLLEPEQRLQMDLLISPVNPYQKQGYAFTVVSKPVEPGDLPATNEQGMVMIPGIPWFYRYIPPFLVLCSALGLAVGIIWLTIWRFNQMGISTLWLT